MNYGDFRHPAFQSFGYLLQPLTYAEAVRNFPALRAFMAGDIPNDYNARA
jgi:hypothetical protein